MCQENIFKLLWNQLGDEMSLRHPSISSALMTAALLIDFSQHHRLSLLCAQVYSGCGIVYCRMRDVCDQLAIELSYRGVKAKAYHAGTEICISQHLVELNCTTFKAWMGLPRN